MHIWGTYVHLYTKYEVSMSNHVPGVVCTDANADIDDANDAKANANDGQSMIV